MLAIRALIRFVCLLLVLVLVPAAVPAAASVQPGGGAFARIPVANPPAPPVLVPKWDPASPQKLVRIDGVLYQEDSGFYYRVVENRITVRLADDTASWNSLVQRAKAAAPRTFDALEEARPVRANRLGTLSLELPAHGDPAEWAELAFRTGLVRYAEVDTYGVYLASPNDFRYPEQWALKNAGQTGGTPGADVDAEAAWELTSGSPSVVVAVLDSGTDVDHEDLSANVWHNAGEIPGNALDDDGNGFIDDWEGWDFGNANNDPRTGFYHGTHVTGIINAVSNNGIGIAGLAGGLSGLGVRAMALAVGEFGPQSGVIDDAILYAADNGAHVITLSLSVGESTAINDALGYAYNTKDVFIDCAAGNNGSSVGYPANRPEVMAVGSSDDNDNVSGFSNPGPEVEVAAPGSDILSTQLNDSYGTSSGTSFAAPYVAGLAALIRSLGPGLPASDVRQLIIDSADDIGAPGFDNESGHGRINAFQALSMVATSDASIQLDAGLYSCADTVSVTVADSDLGGAGSILVTLASATEPGGESVSLNETGFGSGVFRGDVDTSTGAPVADGVLQAGDGEVITAEYVDADDGLGGTNVPKTATATTDCVSPEVSGVAVTSVDEASAIIEWTTNEPGTSRVRFGETAPFGQEASVAGLSYNHSVTLSGLLECVVYDFEVVSADNLGNETVDDNAGTFYSFETFGTFPGVGVGPCHQGRAALDRGIYACTDSAEVTVTDVDLGLDPLVSETVQVLLTSTSEPAGEWVTLTEDGLESSRFAGSIDLQELGPAPDGLLAVSPGDLINATYFDEDDGEGNPRIDVVTAGADCLAPAIGDLRVTAISSTRAEITWTTDEPATSRVEFGASPALGSVVESTDPVTSHLLAVSAFDACAQVHFRVSSVDATGSERVADAGGQPLQFNTREIGGLLFHDNFETDTGWTLGGEWERGAPQGLGSSSADPALAYSGDMVLGNDLDGSGAFPGDYEPATREFAISPVLNASAAGNLEIVIRRKLGVTASDSAIVNVSSPAGGIVWTSSGAIDDAGWLEARHDISAAADGQPSFRVAFGMASVDPGQSYGWNIDEFIVKDATQPDYVDCGGCAGAPAFAGASVVYDPDPCGMSGLAVEWEEAPAWGTGGAGTYEVYRGTTPGFVAGPGSRVASGLTATDWVDAGAPADTELWYLVRARNDEICAGGEGLDDGNEVRLSGTDTLSQPPPGSVEASVRGLAVGKVHVRLEWDPVAGATHYVVRRSASADFAGAETLGTAVAPFFEDAGAVLDGSDGYYRVFAANACGEETP